MYNNLYSSSAASPPITNNPFVTDPTQAQSRFPDISGSPNSQYTSWLQQQQPSFQQSSGTSQAPFLHSSPPPPPQQQLGGGGYYDPYAQQQQQGLAGYFNNSPQQQQLSPTSSFHPQSSFGQQLASAVPQPTLSGTSYSYLNGQQQQQQQQQQQGYHPVQQQLQNNPGYIAQFDPYASIGQGWEGGGGGGGGGGSHTTANTASTSISSPTTTTTTNANAPPGMSHPREYIRTHKPQIESWDTYAWKQLLGAFDSLKDAWGARKKELEGRVTQLGVQMQTVQSQAYAYGGAGMYAMQQLQQEGVRVQGLAKEAESNVDSITASSFQMREVFSGYRQSGDMASKLRVRAATNASVQSLPDWPAPSF